MIGEGIDGIKDDAIWSEKNGKKYKRQACARGLAKVKNSKNHEFTKEGGGWVQVSHGIFCFVGKSSQNSPKPVRIFWSSIPCVFCLYIHG